MDMAISRDGTQIAFDREGEGPAVILVAGATCTRSSWSGPEIAKGLSSGFTVINYDRRGRGDSGDTLPYTVEKEVDDIEALIGAAGGRASLFGHSSGACLVLEAALRLADRVEKIALYEPPYNDDPDYRVAWSAYLEELGDLLAHDRRGEAFALFMRFVGVPESEIDTMRHSPMWPFLEAVAPTLAYDHAYLLEDPRVPTERAAALNTPALVACGSASFPFMATTARTLSEAMPRAELHTVEGQGHEVSPEAIVQLLASFLSSGGGR